MSAKTKVLIADDHALIRMGIRLLISSQKDLELVGEEKDGEAAVETVAKMRPDVVVLDLQMPKLDGVGATERIRRDFPATNVVLLTSHITSDGISHALEKGAVGAVLKSETETALVKAIRMAKEGKSYISAEIISQIKNDPPIKNLSPRQLEIIECLNRGLNNVEIGEQLGIERLTVKTHLQILFQKLGAANRSEAVAIALRKHLLKM